MQNRITRLFGIEFPIVQAGMIWASGTMLSRSEQISVATLEERFNWPINCGLRELGIKASPGLDEFDTLGLDESRSMRHLCVFA